MTGTLRIKICGITKPDQGAAITRLGATALGFICHRPSPRYVAAERIRQIVDALEISVDLIGVFVDAPTADICRTVLAGGLTGVQLHGQETPTFCEQLRQALPTVELIKAVRVKNPQSLDQLSQAWPGVDTFLLDAYVPQQLGGTGKTFNWSDLADFKFSRPWFLAGGLGPENIRQALEQLQPKGVDISSGVESAPGDKDLGRVALLLAQLRQP